MLDSKAFSSGASPFTFRSSVFEIVSPQPDSKCDFPPVANGAGDTGGLPIGANPVRWFPSQQLGQRIPATEQQGDAAQERAFARAVLAEQQSPLACTAVFAVEVQLLVGNGTYVFDLNALEEHGSGSLLG